MDLLRNAPIDPILPHYASPGCMYVFSSVFTAASAARRYLFCFLLQNYTTLEAQRLAMVGPKPKLIDLNCYGRVINGTRL